METKKFYLCDGDKPDCPRSHCYKKGGPCKHTEDVSHALISESDRKFKCFGDALFEMEGVDEQKA